jgi:hypothetical protein
MNQTAVLTALGVNKPSCSVPMVVSEFPLSFPLDCARSKNKKSPRPFRGAGLMRGAKR